MHFCFNARVCMVASLASAITQGTDTVFAQIVPDLTLGAEGSVVAPAVFDGLDGGSVNGLEIGGGAQRGPNLFHSFAEFGVLAGEPVYFVNPAGVANIFSRVTGDGISRVDDVLGVSGPASLFLLNPNGIVFGPGARLDISGSFVASTAAEIEFSDGTVFSTEVPDDSSLLALSVPLGLQLNTPPQGEIESSGELLAGRNLALLGRQLKLSGQLVAGGDLTLIGDGEIRVEAQFESGGDLQFLTATEERGNLVSDRSPRMVAKGNIEFGDYTGAALEVEAGGSIEAEDIHITVSDTGLMEDDSNLGRSFLSSGQAVSLRAGIGVVEEGTSNDIRVGKINTSNETGRDIILSANNNIVIDVLDSSSGATEDTGDGGNISINSEFGEITIEDLDSSSELGHGGDISISSISGDITAENLSSHSSNGDGGSIQIYSASGNIIANHLDSSSIDGNGGAIQISSISGNITTTDYLDSLSFDGNGGAIQISSNSGEITTEDLFSSSLSGDGGNIRISSFSGDITTKNLDSFSAGKDGGNIQVSSFSGDIQTESIGSLSFGGDGGDILISSYSGNIEVGNIDSFSLLGSKGNGGRVSLLTVQGSVTGRKSRVITISLGETSGQGGDVYLSGKTVEGLDVTTISRTENSGDVKILSQDGDLTVSDLSIISSGQVEILNPDEEPFIEGDETISLSLADLGESGNILIESNGNISLKNVEIQADANSTEQAGDITVVSPGTVDLTNSKLNSNANSRGNAGDITINVAHLIISNGGRVLANTSGLGQGGNISIDASQSVHLGEDTQDSKPVISVESSGPGQPGNIIINTPNFTLSDTARIAATATEAATNPKDRGSITLNANQIVLAGTVGIFAETKGQSSGGRLTLRSYQKNSDLDIHLAPGAQISVATNGSGMGGNLRIVAPSLISISGPGVISAETNSTGQAGELLVQTQRFKLQDGATLSSSTSSYGQGGTINLNASESITLNNNAGLIAQSTNTGNAGNIQLTTANLSLTHQSQIATSTAGEGNAGNITLNPGQNNTLNINIDNSILTAATSSSGDGGDLEFKASDAINITGNGTLTAQTSATGSAGNVRITTDRLTLDQGTTLSTTATTTANPPANEDGSKANITLNANEMNLFGTVQVLSETQGNAKAGKLTLQTNGAEDLNINLRDNSKVSASTSGNGNGGELSIRADNNLTVSGQGTLSAETSGRGQAGAINVEAQRLTLQNGATLSSSTSSSGAGGDISVKANDGITLLNRASLIAKSTETASGKAGDVTLHTSALTLDHASVTVSSQGTGDGGNIDVGASRATFMRNSSVIETDAANSGNGGNIQLDTPILIGYQGDNSDIIANAQQGNGGQIEITAKNILNFEQQDGQNKTTLRSNATNDISASSEGGTDGIITLNTPETDPADSLSELPTDIVDGSRIIAQNLCHQGQGSEFIITGRGGLPQGPQDTLQAPSDWEDWRFPEQLADVVLKDNELNLEELHLKQTTTATPIAQATATKTTQPTITEAQGWQKTATGAIQLIAAPTQPTAVAQATSPLACRQLKRHLPG